MNITLPAERLAPAWLNVWVATGSDPDVPVLYRTVGVEFYEGRAVRLVATDRYLLLHSVVALDPDAEPTALDEAPDRSLTVSDHDARVVALLGYLAKRTRHKDYVPGSIEVSLSVGSIEDDDAPTLDPTLDRLGLVVATDSEKVVAPLLGTDLPNWRNVDELFAVDPVGLTAWSPKMLGRLGRLGGVIRMELSAGLARLDVQSVPAVAGFAAQVKVATDEVLS